MQIPKQPSKTLQRLKMLVGLECRVYIRSNPETMISGILDSFDLDVVPSLLIVDCADRGKRIINFQDVSFIEEMIIAR